MDLQKITSTGTAVAVIGGGTLMGGNYAIDTATAVPVLATFCKSINIPQLVFPSQHINVCQFYPLNLYMFD